MTPVLTLPLREGQAQAGLLTLPRQEQRAWKPVTSRDRTATQERGSIMTSITALHGVVAEHIAAVNAFDEDAIVATFAEDALVNDAHREFWGTAAIRRWVAREMVGDKVTLEVTEVIEHYGDTIVRARYDGEYDKTSLPDELIMSNYFTVRDGKIVSMMIIRNTPAGY
jgi:hypothetical protein